MDRDQIRNLIEYDKNSGKCLWKERDEKLFKPGKFNTAKGLSKRWNDMYSGKMVGNFDAKGYIVCKIFGKVYKLHRLIWLYMTGEWPDLVDHKNGIRHDNRWKNLRNVDVDVNSKNHSIRKDNSSGVTGISYHKKTGKWVARISHNGKRVCLGYFDNMDDAINEREKYVEIFGYSDRHGK